MKAQNKYVVGAQVIGASAGSVDLPKWEKWAIAIGALASLATLIEVTAKALNGRLHK